MRLFVMETLTTQDLLRIIQIQRETKTRIYIQKQA